MEAILHAQFELENAEPKSLPNSLHRLNNLLDQAIEGTHLTRRELLSVLRNRYKDYKRAQRNGFRSVQSCAARTFSRIGRTVVLTPSNIGLENLHLIHRIDVHDQLQVVSRPALPPSE